MLHALSAVEGSRVLAEQVLTADTASITLSGIPSGYGDIRIAAYARSTQSAAVVGLLFRFNSDSGANYDYIYTQNSNTTVTGVSTAADSELDLVAPAATAAASSFASWDILVPAYADTTGHKSGTFVGGMAEATAGNTRTRAGAFRWRNTAAITSVTMTLGSDSLATGSSLRVYGMA